jgi:hypothetical protein
MNQPGAFLHADQAQSTFALRRARVKPISIIANG